MMRGTFCDWLINQGVQFHPETVIVDITSVSYDLHERAFKLSDEDVDKLLGFEQCEKTNAISIPMFDYMFLEEKSPTGYFGAYAFKLPPLNDDAAFDDPDDPDDVPLSTITAYSITPFMRIDGSKTFCIDEEWDIEWNKNGIYTGHTHGGGLNDVIQRQIDYYGSPFDFDWFDSSDFTILTSVILSLQYFHKKAEVELVDYPRNYRRRVQRETGKEPSPYFRIIAPGKTVKQNTNPSQSTGNSIKLPLHTVRGHFRHVENHPIEHFNGTFWIAAHTRGDEKLGKLQKHYKIRLPQQDSIAS